MHCAEKQCQAAAKRLLRQRLVVIALLCVALSSAATAAKDADGALAQAAVTAPAARPRMLDRPAAKREDPQRQLLLSVAQAGKRLVAVGASGLVAISDDGGTSWRQAKSVPTSATLTGVRFSTPQDGWAIGHLGVVLLTRDGGETWSRKLDGIEAAKLSYEAAQQRAARDTSEASLMQRKLAKLAVEDGPNKPFLVVHTDAPDHALVMGAFGLALETKDGGATWTALADNFDNPHGQHYYGLVRTKKAQVAVGEQGLLMRSTDGRTFKALESPYNGTLFGVLGRTDGNLVAYGLRGNLVHSVDHGANWTKVASGIPASIQTGTVLGDGTIVLASESGQLVVSRDGGRTFTVLSKHVQPAADVIALDNKSLLVVGPRGIERVELGAEQDKK